MSPPEYGDNINVAVTTVTGGKKTTILSLLIATLTLAG